MESLLRMQDTAAALFGAGPGIGRSCALHLARAGCRLAIVDVDAAQAEKVASEVRELGRPAHVFEADVTSEAAARSTLDVAAGALGRIDAVVNIIGGASWAPLLELDEETWDRDMSVNLKHHFFVSRAAAQRMVDQGEGGTIVMVSSVSGLFSAPRHAAYGAAKAGLVALTKTMGEEWSAFGIRVNAVAPGGVLTPHFKELVEEGTAAPDEGTMARLADPDDIAGAALFLSSALSRRITGQTLIVDGGISTANPFGLASR